MSEIPDNLRYTESHEWVLFEDDGSILVGITDHAQNLLGDMVYIELPEVNTPVSVGDECAVVESVKAASDVYSPIRGEIIRINDKLLDSPVVVNTDPYGEGWLFAIMPEEDADMSDLLDAEEYAQIISEE
jgi:glycine cleavage system H protein